MNFVNNDRGFGMFNSSPRSGMLNKSDESLNSGIGGSKTPQYMIQCEDIFGSEATADKYGDKGDLDPPSASPCLWVEAGHARLATYDSSGELSGDGKVVCKDPIVCMKFGGWAPSIQFHIFNGQAVEKIQIFRLMHANGAIQVVQQTTYATCLFKTYEQAGDTITFSFCFTSLEDLCNMYKHDSTKEGTFGVTFDCKSMTFGES